MLRQKKKKKLNKVLMPFVDYPNNSKGTSYTFGDKTNDSKTGCYNSSELFLIILVRSSILCTKLSNLCYFSTMHPIFLV